ncbi:MAG: PilZ domain-containing protein, partial [Spirochaetia bacterium]
DSRLYEMKKAERPPADGTSHAIQEPRGATGVLVPSPMQRADSGETQGRDKRKWERVPLAGTSAHIVWNEGALTTAPVIDVSYGGIALLVENPEVFPTSLQAVLHMPIQLPVNVSLRKSYEQRIHGEGTRVGCAFVI